VPTPSPAPLLLSKITPPPPRRELLPRSRLLALLAGWEHPLTLIAAAAGFGKSTLVRQWLFQIENREVRIEKAGQATDHSSFSILNSSPQVAWLSLDPDDNDPVRFWRYLLGAIERVHPGLDAEIGAFFQGPESGLEVIITSLLNQLQQAGRPLALVLDDYHVIEQAAIHRGLSYTIDHLPAHVRVVLLSRTDPPLPLSRWRARGQLSELRAAQLRFTPAETHAFLVDLMGLDLAPDQTGVLDARTEGWAAGLQLAALSLRGQADPAGFITQFAASHRTALDYLIDEVVAQQPPTVQHFLLQTSILDRMCAELCGAVVEEEGRKMKDEAYTAGSDQAGTLILHPSSFILQQIERQNLFLIPLDAEGVWYRYHHLFRAALRQRLQRQVPTQIPALHRRAAAWLAGAGLTAEAIDHAVAAGDHAVAADLIEAAAWPALLGGETATVQRWLDSLPAALCSTRPGLLLWRAWSALALPDGPALARAVSEAEPVLAAHEPPDSPRWGELLALKGWLARDSGMAAQSYELSMQALARLAPDDSILRGMVGVNATLAAWAMGDYGLARTQAEAAIAHADRAQNSFLTALSRSVYAQMLVDEGQITQAEAHARLVLEAAEARGLARWPIYAFCHVALAEVALLRNQTAIARQHVEATRTLLSSGVFKDALTSALQVQIGLARANGDPAALEALLVQLEQTQRAMGMPAVEQSWHVQRAWLALLEGRAEQAAEQLDLARVDSAARMARALLLVIQGRPDAALKLLDGQPQPRFARLHGVAATQLIAPLRALALSAGGQAAAADQVLGAALSRAAVEGMLRPFLDLGAHLAPLLEAQNVKRKAQNDPLAPFIQQLLTTISSQRGTPAMTDLGEAVLRSPFYALRLVEPLSPRELEVLALLVEGATNPQIAARLIITERTAKKHVTNILGKLGVANRTQAITRAREVGLL